MKCWKSQGPFWVRSPHGMITGVCQGLADTFDLDVKWVRLIWVVGLFFFTVGFWLYLLLSITFPRADRWAEAQMPRILGVCVRISQRTGLEIGIVRLLAVLSIFMFFIFTIIVYFILHLSLEDKKQDQSPSAHLM